MPISKSTSFACMIVDSTLQNTIMKQTIESAFLEKYLQRLLLAEVVVANFKYYSNIINAHEVFVNINSSLQLTTVFSD